MATITAQVDDAKQSSGAGIKLITFAREVWSEAQQVGSKFKVLGTTQKSMDGGNYKLFARTKKRAFSSKAQGIIRTPANEQDYDRRALFVKPWHEATQVDIGDMVDATSNVLEDAKRELMKAEGRLIDTVILSSLVEPAYHSSDADKTTAGRTDYLTSTISLTQHQKVGAYVDAGKTGTTAQAKFDADTIEKVLHQFALRDVEDDLCATLTPALKLILRRNTDFKNAENIFSPMKRSVDDNREGFSYKGITWISCSQSILPIRNQSNGGIKAVTPADTLATANKIPAIVLDRDSSGTVYSYTGDGKDSITDVAGTSTALTAVTITSGDVTAGNLAAVAAKGSDLVYIWGKSALFFADRPEEMFSADSELPLFSHAKQSYQRVTFGALLIDDAYAMCVPLAGAITAS